MLVAVSDLHLNDGTCGKSLSAGAFKIFQERLEQQKFMPLQLMSYLAFFTGDERSGRRHEAWLGKLV